jgi:peptidoglycan/LPS O-acetylase OafA/YrhL
MTQSTRPLNLPLAYLRAFIILLVVAHHAALAYYPKAPFAAVSLVTNPRWWQAFPVVDSAHWAGFYPFVIFNDSFFMALMFLLSGLFVWKSLERKHPGPFLKHRLRRLGLPFALFSLIGPLAYYPAYLQSHTHPGFWHEWLALGNWPAGPVWFIWVLLAFDIFALAIFRIMPGRFLVLGRKLAHQPPHVVVGLLLLLSAFAYVPMTLRFGLYSLWIHGPFYFQTNRILYYLVYFLFGLALGASGEKTFIRTEGSLAANWLRWVAAAIGGFGVFTTITFISHRYLWSHDLDLSDLYFHSSIDFAFTLTSALTCFAFLALFLHFVRKRRPVLDNLFACSYGIFLTHYFFVSWSQYILLPWHAPAWLKAAIVFVVSVAGSWAFTAFARRLMELSGIHPGLQRTSSTPLALSTALSNAKARVFEGV